MNYGNANDLIQKCPQCTESIDKHRISLIRSSDKTDALARKLQDHLTKVNISAILKGLDLDRTSTMVGAAIVTFNTSAQPRQYVTVSGPGVLLLKHIASMGKDITVVDMANALVGQNKVRNINKAAIEPNTEKGIEYPLGSCAAQKLLTAIFRDGASADTIKSIEMSEIMWRAAGESAGPGSRQWSSGEIVPSCKTCKQVLPQMLCNLLDD